MDETQTQAVIEPKPIEPKPYPRHLALALRESLADTPVVWVGGPRQCGKTTLVQQFASEMPYFSLDDPALLAAVRSDPLGFAQRLDRAIIDEAQRAPEFTLALKLVVDRDRRPGRFLLTGSANLMALPQVADSLAGRIALHTLLPLSQSELDYRPNDFLHRAQTQDWPTTPLPPLADGRIATVLAGGYPEMRSRATVARRQAWARSYLATLMARDVQDVADIQHLNKLTPLLTQAAGLCGQLLNLSTLGGSLGLDTKTVDRYLGVLEKMFLLQRVPAWGRNELGRLVKTPKLHFLDAGLQATLTRLTPDLAQGDRSRFGATLETWVHAELRKALTLNPEDWQIGHYRDKDQVEVDFVLESGLRQIIGIEVKAAASVSAGDFKGLKRLRDQTGPSFLTGIVLYDGTHVLPFGEGLWAVPLGLL